MKKFFIICLFAIVSHGGLVYCQSYSFNYDDSGNRESRTIPLTKSTRSSNDTKNVHEYNENMKSLEISIYPNPTKGIITVNLNNLDETNSSAIYIYDDSGKLLESKVDLQEVNLFDFSNYARGIYFLRIISGNSKSEWKIIKE